MATRAGHHKKKSAPRKRKAASSYAGKERRVAAGEFKAKCLAIIDEVNRTGEEVIITKRGKPSARLVPVREVQKDSFIGRLEGIMKINGDPDDLIKPVFPEQDWDMLK